MRGGFVVDMRWAKGQIQELTIHSRLGGNLRLRSYAPLPKPVGFKVKMVRINSKNPNPLYPRAHIKTPLKHTAMHLPQLSLDKSLVVELATEAGRSYHWGLH